METLPTSLSGTLLQLLELAQYTEEQYSRYYLSLAEKFARHPEVEAFWRSYAAEENGHAAWLNGLRARVGPALLARPADPELLRMARRTAAIDFDALIQSTTDLQIAFETANDLEHNETNTIFEFLIGYFTSDLNALAFLRSQLHDHVNRLLTGFPEPYRLASVRQGVPAE